MSLSSIPNDLLVEKDNLLTFLSCLDGITDAMYRECLRVFSEEKIWLRDLITLENPHQQLIAEKTFSALKRRSGRPLFTVGEVITLVNRLGHLATFLTHERGETKFAYLYNRVLNQELALKEYFSASLPSAALRSEMEIKRSSRELEMELR